MSNQPLPIPLLDLSCLRTLVAVAQTGSITAAADLVHLSQSAASLQIRRLEEQLSCKLVIRLARGVELTLAGEALLSHAKRLLDLNRETVNVVRETGTDIPILLGAPHDVIQPYVPEAIRAFQAQNHRKVKVVSASTRALRDALDRGELDMIITTDTREDPLSICLARRKLVWVSASDSKRGTERPLPVLFSKECMISDIAVSALSRAGVDHFIVEQIAEPLLMNAAIAADQGLHALIADERPNFLVEAAPSFALPELPDLTINLTVSSIKNPDLHALADHLALAFADA